jgi:phosphoenolpyruvate carboxykinase (GTP)
MGAIDRTGLGVSDATMRNLLSVDRGEWKTELVGLREFFSKFGSKLPAEMSGHVDALEKRLG